MPIIQVEGLVKEYRTPRRQPGLWGGLRTLFTREYDTTRAVDGIDLTIREGELVGYIGSNGAGKSTTIKLLTGILVPTSGQVEVAGLVPWQQRHRNALNIGVVFGQRTQLWWDLPLIESFRLIAKLYRIAPAVFKRNLEEFTDLLGIHEFIQRPVRQLSLGQRMRGDLVAAMLYEPRILYLDEPTVGLDVLAKEQILKFLEATNRSKRTTIVLTTHDIGDIERLCQRIVMIDRGRVIYDGSPTQLKARYAPHQTLIVQLEVGDGKVEVPNTEVVRHKGREVWLRFDPLQVSVPSLISTVTARYPVLDLEIVRPDLETVVRQIYTESQGT